jgi:hypothetical protein
VSAALFFVTARTARRHQWNPRILLGFSALSGLGLIAMVVTDWPGEQLSRFWADHSILATVVSSLLLVSVGYLAFEAGESAEQVKLNQCVTSAGLSGLVDHLVDVDIALSMIARNRLSADYERDGKPLRWVRPIRERLQAAEADPDVQIHGVGLPGQPAAPDWHHDLVDQCIRRVIAGMRDWAALVSVSDDGRTVLKKLGEVRLGLMQLRNEIGSHGLDQPDGHLHILRKRLQLMAVGLEYVSSPNYPRPGLLNFLPGGHSPLEIDDAVRKMTKLSPLTVGTLIPLLKKVG